MLIYEGAKYRPKTFVQYLYGTENKCGVCCYPQSRWLLLKQHDHKVTLIRKNVIITIDKDDFERSWQEARKEKV